MVRKWSFAMRVLVTGGAGFIGSNFVRRAIDGTLPGISEIIILDKLTYAGTKTNLSMLAKDSYRLEVGDICDVDLVNSLTKGVDAVINFAAESHVDRSISSASEFVRTNVLGTQTLLDASLRNEVGTFVQVSTDEVYGTIPKGSWREDFPLLPNSPYSASKAGSDLIVRAYNKTFGLDTRVTRCSNNYGPHQFPEKVIPRFVTNLMEGKKVPLYGEGKNVRDWLHVDDHCRGIFLALTKGKSGEIYNIGGGRELTNLELTAKVLELMGKDESWIERVPDRLGHDLRYSVDHSKASAELGYRPTISFEKGIRETIDWYVANENWWRPLKR